MEFKFCDIASTTRLAFDLLNDASFSLKIDLLDLGDVFERVESSFERHQYLVHIFSSRGRYSLVFHVPSFIISSLLFKNFPSKFLALSSQSFLHNQYSKIYSSKLS